jgi:micrococcal nuclease
MPVISFLLLNLVTGPSPQPARDAVPLRNCRAVDGDTLRCGRERIRLLGIDAPEMPGHCQPGRRCVPGDPFASRASLAKAINGRLSIERIGADRYGRTLGLVRGPGGDLSCWQLRSAQARYRADWDDGRALARRCREAR